MKILIFDTTLRDGEQSPGASLTIEEKLVVAKQLAKLGVDVIEAGFPISSPGDFESVKLIAQKVEGPIICGLARTMKEDIQRAWDAIKYSEKPRIHTFIATSQIHIEKKLRKSKEEVIEIVTEAVEFAKSLCNDVEFSPEDAARTDIDYMCDVVRAAIKAGATTINIPDTVGYAVPEEFGARIKAVFEKVPEAKNIIISVHTHNDLGMAVANSLAAVKEGARQIECTVNGIGERAGNCSLEEVVMAMKTRKDYFKDIQLSINTKEIYPSSVLVSNLTGIDVQRNKAIVGQNAFAHEAGIHQHGVLHDKKTYEIMNPEDVGWAGTNLVIGKHSGKAAVEAVLNSYGYDLEKEKILEISSKVKELADKQKEIRAEDIMAITHEVIGRLSDEQEIIKLAEVQVTSGNSTTPTATVKVILNGEEKTGVGTGIGPVDAVAHAITSLIDPSIKLKDFHLKSISGGTNALADVTIKVENEKGEIFSAQGIDGDVVMASAIALVQGINKSLNFERK